MYGCIFNPRKRHSRNTRGSETSNRNQQRHGEIDGAGTGSFRKQLNKRAIIEPRHNEWSQEGISPFSQHEIKQGWELDLNLKGKRRIFLNGAGDLLLELTASGWSTP